MWTPLLAGAVCASGQSAEVRATRQVEVWTYPAVDIETSSIPLGFLYQDDVTGVTPNLFAMQLPQVWDLVSFAHAD